MFGRKEDPGDSERVQFRTQLLGAFVEAGGDECAVDLLLAQHESGAGNADDMHGRAAFNKARAQIRYVRCFADHQYSEA